VPYAYAFRGEELAVSKMRQFSASQGLDFTLWPELPDRFCKNIPLHYSDVHTVNLLW
jgi:hypothetical protein